MPTIPFKPILLFAAAIATHAAGPADARWEGSISIPGRELRVVVDLSSDAAGKWTGSATFPGLAIKGAALSDIGVSGSEVRFTVKGALDNPSFLGQIDGQGTLSGKFQQAGNVASFTLRKAGAAQVDAAQASTAVAKELEGEWYGEFSFNGNPLKARLTFTHHPGAGATAEFHVIGKRDNNIPVDLVVQDGKWLVVRSSEFRMKYEGEFRAPDEIAGTFSQAPLEFPLVLKRRTP